MSIVAGGNEFVDVLRLLGNSAEVERRVNALNEARARAEETIALAGKASEILNLREQINADVTEAKRVLEDARVQAQTLVADGRKRAEEIIAEANMLLERQKEANIEADRKSGEMLAAAQAQATEAAGLHRDALALMAEAQNIKIKAEQDSVLAQETVASFKDKLATLRDVQDQFSTALGRM